jgi:aminoglycoside phosphotransferase (APT) family kinase protein
MHAGEVDTDVELVRRLISAQFPDWAGLGVEHVPSSGTVNALYQLGPAMVARLPRTDWAGDSFARQARWLPIIARSVQVQVPVPLAKGRPAFGYPYAWCVYSWLPGDPVVAGSGPGQPALARALGAFVSALRDVDTADAPPQRRGDLREQWDGPVRSALAELRHDIDTAAAEAAWEQALAAPGWPGRPRWVHGDLMPANLLTTGGVLTGVIDWEAAGVGDPAVDLMVAWNALGPEGRSIFRRSLEVDEDTWARGRGWALCTGLVALPYYRETNPELAANARFRIAQVLAG